MEFLAEDGITLRAVVTGATNGPRLILGHGNGLAISGYEVFWSLLAKDFQLVLLDVRSHGKSDVSSLDAHNWAQFERDYEMCLRGIEDTLGPRPSFGVFHSLSAVIALGHLKKYQRRLKGLLLFDPPLMPPIESPCRKSHVEEMLRLADRVRQRQSCFAAPEELAGVFRRGRTLAKWSDKACQDMAKSVLRESDDGASWCLACPPLHEAKIFESNVDESLWGLFGCLDMPLKLVCADPNVPGVQPSAHSTRELAETFKVAYEAVPGSTHFLQLEYPVQCATITKNYCKGLLAG
ncbi:MAG: alpha/beta fold hydrolase [Pusillimonas sp.]